MQDLIVDLARRIEKLEKTMMNFLGYEDNGGDNKEYGRNWSISVKKEDDECMVRTIKCLGFLFEAHHTIVFD